jgi:AraC-like DNA-binding protein
MTPERRQELVLLRRARDLIDRRFAEPLDVPAIAAAVHLSAAHFSRRFRAVYGESPYQYLMTRRIERACALLRAGVSVTDACMQVGCTSLGSFSSRFTEIVGVPPSVYRTAEHAAEALMPDCTARLVTRPPRTSRIREAAGGSAA